MPQKYTKKDAVRCAERLAEILGKEFGNCWIKEDGKLKAKIGCWNVDYAPMYGGCTIEEIANEGGAVTQPMGMGRLKPEAFCRATDFAIRAVDITKGRQRPY